MGSGEGGMNMTSNDYIAEYVKERHKSILGIEFAFWKVSRVCREFAKSLNDVFAYDALNDDADEEDEELCRLW